MKLRGSTREALGNAWRPYEQKPGIFDGSSHFRFLDVVKGAGKHLAGPPTRLSLPLGPASVKDARAVALRAASRWPKTLCLVDSSHKILVSSFD